MSVVEPPDSELLEAAARGDGEAYGAFFRRHVKALTIYGVRRCADSHDVADLVADTFLIALQASGRYVPEMDTALPWLFGIARRVLVRSRRRSAGARRVAEKATGALLFAPSEEEEVVAAIDAARQRPLLEAALARLSPGEREILELIAYDGLTPSEAAVALDVTPNAARLRLSRARGHLREMLDIPTSIETEAGHAY